MADGTHATGERHRGHSEPAGERRRERSERSWRARAPIVSDAERAGHGRLAAALIVGIGLAGCGSAVLPAVASAAKHLVRVHPRSAVTDHRSSVVRRGPTVLSVVSVAAPASPPVPAPATVGGPAVATVGGPAVAAKCRNTGLVPTASNLPEVAAATLCLVNKARQAAGLEALSESGDLDRAAAGHSRDMVAEDYFDHVAPDGSSPDQRVRAAGYVPDGPGDAVAENIAVATLWAATPARTVASWMASAGHRENILDPDFTETGIGVAATTPAIFSRHAGGTYTEDFA